LERTLTPEEKIKRAEEIYARRRSGYVRPTVATVKVSEEKNYGLFRKMILQIVICLVIYFIFYLIQNSNYIFSEDVINKTKEILSYDIDLVQMWDGVANGFYSWTEGMVPNNANNTILENTILNEIDSNAIGGAELENVILETATLGISEENNTIEGQEIKETVENETQQNEIQENKVQEVNEKNKQEQVAQTDEEYIKSNFSFIKPVEGIVSSEFGLRDVANPIVSKNHVGIDIAANTGTIIKAAMEGTVTVCSTTGDYGYHIKITNNDVSTLYAHCSKLYVKNGDIIKQGQEIAEVGSTGKSTGPHLHFEIIRGMTYINPRDIIEF